MSNGEVKKSLNLHVINMHLYFYLCFSKISGGYTKTIPYYYADEFDKRISEAISVQQQQTK